MPKVTSANPFFAGTTKLAGIFLTLFALVYSGYAQQSVLKSNTTDQSIWINRNEIELIASEFVAASPKHIEGFSFIEFEIHPTKNIFEHKLLVVSDSSLIEPTNSLVKKFKFNTKDTLFKVRFILRFIHRDPSPSPTTCRTFDKEVEVLNFNELSNLISFESIAKSNGHSGLALFRVLIDETGKTVQVAEVISQDSVYLNTLLKHVNILRCLPAIQNKRAVAQWTNIGFSLRKIDPTIITSNVNESANKAYKMHIEHINKQLPDILKSISKETAGRLLDDYISFKFGIITDKTGRPVALDMAGFKDNIVINIVLSIVNQLKLTPAKLGPYYHYFMVPVYLPLYQYRRSYYNKDVKELLQIKDADKEDSLLLKEAIPLNMSEFSKKVDYPLLAKEGGIQGKVLFKIFVDIDGNYVQHQVLYSPHPLLLAETEKHISILKFVPGIGLDGKPTPSWVRVPVDFHLKE